MPVGGFADDAVIGNGAITLSDRPGIGFEGQAGLYKIMRGLAGIWSPNRRHVAFATAIADNSRPA